MTKNPRVIISFAGFLLVAPREARWSRFLIFPTCCLTPRVPSYGIFDTAHVLEYAAGIILGKVPESFVPRNEFWPVFS